MVCCSLMYVTLSVIGVFCTALTGTLELNVTPVVVFGVHLTVLGDLYTVSPN